MLPTMAVVGERGGAQAVCRDGAAGALLQGRRRDLKQLGVAEKPVQIVRTRSWIGAAPTYDVFPTLIPTASTDAWVEWR